MPPKPPTKPPVSAPKGESIFAAMKKNSRLAKHLTKAKQVVAVREFEGPDGDYPTRLNRVNHYLKDNVLSIVLEFRCIDPEYDGQKLVIFTKFADETVGLCRSLEEVQDEFFMMLQLLGVDTDLDDVGMDAALKKITDSKETVTIRVKSFTSKKGVSGKRYSVVGIGKASEEVANTEYVEDDGTEHDVPDEVTEEQVDEWEEENAEEEVIEEDVVEEESSNLPSEWVGFAMLYKNAEVEILEADDVALKCVVKGADGKKKRVLFSELSPA